MRRFSLAGLMLLSILASPAAGAESRPPSAVVSARAGAFVLPPTDATWSAWSGPTVVPLMPHGTTPAATVAATSEPDPDLPRLDRRLTLRPGELVRFHLAFRPMHLGFSHGVLRAGWFETGRFGFGTRTWRVPRQARRGRVFLDATDAIGNRLTYSFDFVVRRR